MMSSSKYVDRLSIAREKLRGLGLLHTEGFAGVGMIVGPLRGTFFACGHVCVRVRGY